MSKRYDDESMCSECDLIQSAFTGHFREAITYQRIIFAKGDIYGYLRKTPQELQKLPVTSPVLSCPVLSYGA